MPTVARRESAPSVHQVLRAPGKPLDPAMRAAMEPQFRHDFSRVRVHADNEAAASANSMGALAYTVGRHMIFAEGQYAPATRAGQRLLAHELAHTVQQRSTAEGAGMAQLHAGAVNDPLEVEAERASEAAAAGVRTHIPFLRQEAAPVLRRQPKPGPEIPSPPPIEKLPPKKEEITGTTGPVECQPHADSKLPCTPQPVSIAAFQKLGAPPDALGFTIPGRKFTAPEVITTPAGKDKGGEVVILPTSAAPISCQSYFVKGGTDIQRTMPLDKDTRAAEQCNGRYTATVSVSAKGAERAKAAEMEHCKDYKYAFDISLGCYAGVINDLAKKNATFPSQQAAEDAVTKKVGRPPGQWSAYYIHLLDQSATRDSKEKKWHIPVDPNPLGVTPVGTGHCAAASKIVVDQHSYPELGRHPSSQIIK